MSETFKTILVIVIVGIVFVAIWSYYGKSQIATETLVAKRKPGDPVVGVSQETIDTIMGGVYKKTTLENLPTITFDWNRPVRDINLPSTTIAGVLKPAPEKGPIRIFNVNNL